ncbi:MAG: hypothetical protein ONB48_07010 [candidate division KSB1 bacterium]|nr:hypothetical protein [candidate division KSB1 bacterium]MDZ7273292.1 hypothetical protein [candidate division KSB1 bacterium]MDZ7285394.1 hypothetical protein [candidate division KSB1 bacterium]MDZ7298426.1 hypothetical protein [candidate division KSB1 bacterium]MDZ7307691.1 hypothetical protein [candidate division KSB1 bacterium]
MMTILCGLLWIISISASTPQAAVAARKHPPSLKEGVLAAPARHFPK